MTHVYLSVTEFDSTIGLTYLKGMHLNDSKAALSSHKDRHANIGLYVPCHSFAFVLIRDFCSGELALPAFHHILTDPRMRHIPLILETPIFESPSVWKEEIAVLNELSGLTAEGMQGKRVEMVKRVKDALALAEKDSGKAKGKKKLKEAKTKKGLEEAIDDDDVDDDEG